MIYENPAICHGAGEKYAYAADIATEIAARMKGGGILPFILLRAFAKGHSVHTL